MLNIAIMGLCLLYVSCVHAAKVGIEIQFPSLAVMKDSHGSELPTAQVGEQFTIEVKILAQEGNSVVVESVEGLEKLQILHKESSYEVRLGRNYNEQIDVVHYTVQAAHKGTFKLGPVKVKCDGKGYMSGSYYYNVIDAPQVQPKQRHQQSGGGTASYAARQGNQPFISCQMALPRTNVFLGESFEMSVLVYMYGRVVDHALKPREFPGFTSLFLGAMPPREERHGGKTLEVREYKYLLTPLKTGSFQVGPCELIYAVPVQNVLHNFFNVLRQEERQLVSNYCTVTVDPLPQHKGRVDGIGSFTHFEVFTDKAECVCNEPLKVTFTIEGTGNFENITELKLLLPAAYRFYKSKAEIIETQQGGKVRRKSFEYIVQIPTAGACTIPEQKFMFFDPQDKTYKTLVSRAIELNVIQDPHNVNAPMQVNNENAQEKKATNKGRESTAKQAAHDEIAYIEEGGSFGRPRPFAFPWWVMVLAILLPFVFVQEWIVSQFRRIARLRRTPDQEWQILVKNKQRNLDGLLREQNARGLHQFFDSLCKELFSIESHQTVEKELEHTLSALSWDHEKIQYFFEYLSMCASLHFVAKDSELEFLSKKALDKAQYWFSLLTAKKVQDHHEDLAEFK